jgi:hypothetical protein
MDLPFPFPKVPHHAPGRNCPGLLVPEPAASEASEGKTALRCDECGEVVGTMNTWPFSDLASLALAGGMATFVPDPEHIKALPEPVRRYIHELETRADPAGNIAEIALLKENNAALWKRVQELEQEPKHFAGQDPKKALDLAVELQRIYDSEINIRISWFWDGGVEVRLGDEMNGYETEETVSSVPEILPRLQEAIAHFYPQSSYSASLDPAIAKRAESRLFRPPRTGARAICPHCGAPNANTLFDELYAFVCARCGASVTIDPPKIQ